MRKNAYLPCARFYKVGRGGFRGQKSKKSVFFDDDSGMPYLGGSDPYFPRISGHRQSLPHLSVLICGKKKKCLLPPSHFLGRLRYADGKNTNFYRKNLDFWTPPILRLNNAIFGLPTLGEVKNFQKSRRKMA